MFWKLSVPTSARPRFATGCSSPALFAAGSDHRSAIAHLFELISLSEASSTRSVRRSGPYAPYLNLIEAIERTTRFAIRKQGRPAGAPGGRLQPGAAESMTSAELLDAEI